MQNELICAKCNIALEERQVEFSYMGAVFHHDFPCCPSCGQIFISEEIAKGKMTEVEQELEDK